MLQIDTISFRNSKLSVTDRWLLPVVLAYGIFGSILTVMARTTGRTPDAQGLISTAGVALLLCALAALWYGSRHGSISLVQNGFSFGWGMWVNLGLVVATSLLLARQIEPISPPIVGSTPWMILGAFTEEIAFRIYLIRILSVVISPRKGHATWAVILSAAFFTMLHLSGRTAAGLYAVFSYSIIMGVATYLTKSVLFAAYVHVVTNTSQELGFLGGGVVIAAYLVISVYLSFRRRHSVTTSSPPDTPSR